MLVQLRCTGQNLLQLKQPLSSLEKVSGPMLSDDATLLGQLSSMGAASQQGGNPSWALRQCKKETKESATSVAGGSPAPPL